MLSEGKDVGEIEKGYVQELAEKCSRELRLGKPPMPPKLPNDLRRLGVLQAGDPARNWPEEIKARVNPLFKRILERLIAVEKPDYRCIGKLVVAIAAISVDTVSVRVIRMILEGEKVDETRLARLLVEAGMDKTPRPERIGRYLDTLKRLVENLVNLSDCAGKLPLVALPVELWGYRLRLGKNRRTPSPG